MAEMDLKLRIVPDLTLLKKSIKDLSNGGSLGEKKKEDSRSKDSKKLLGSIKNLTKIVGIVAIGALLIRELLRVFEPIIKLLGVILSLLFLPLVPLLKPILIILADMAKNIATSAGAFLAGDIGLGEFIAQAGAELITGLADIIPIVLDIFLQILNGFAQALPTLIPILGEALVKIVDALLEFVPQFVEGLTAFIEALPIEDIVKVVTDVIKAIIPLIGEFVDAFVEVIEALLPHIPEMVDALIPALVAIIDALLPLIPLIMDALITVMDALVRALFAAIIGSVGLFFKGNFNTNETSGQDMIIRPNGQIIRTDPADTLIATKDPDELFGKGEGGFTFSPTINLNGPINSDLDVKRIAEQIAQIGADALSRRTGSLRF